MFPRWALAEWTRNQGESTDKKKILYYLWVSHAQVLATVLKWMAAIFFLLFFLLSSHFRLSYYPHRLRDFSSLLTCTFGPEAKHSVFADFKSLEDEDNPAFYIHVIEKPKE